MNRLKTIVLFAGIFAIGLGAISLSGISATTLVSAAPQPDSFGMLGHVEYKVIDPTGVIKHYSQGDNIVVISGKDCVAQLVFDNSTSTVCPLGNNVFTHIAIGNETSGASLPNTLSELDSQVVDQDCATTGDDGEMARKTVSPTFTAAVTGTGTVVILDTSSDPFDFGLSNSTENIMQSGIFNEPETAIDAVTGECTTLGASTMFSIQNLNGVTGIAVSEGDSLSVKWTITVG